jgi:hypothetical protein
VKLVLIFGCFGIIKQLSVRDNFTNVYVAASGIVMTYNMTLIVFIITTSVKTTGVAAETSQIFHRIAHQTQLTQSQKIDFICLTKQIDSRNLKFSNIFFSIDWSVLMTVSELNTIKEPSIDTWWYSKNQLKFCLLPDDFNNSHLPGHHLPV